MSDVKCSRFVLRRRQNFATAMVARSALCAAGSCCLAILFASGCLGQAPLSPARASITGGVVSAAGEPLRRVTLRLTAPPRLPFGSSTETPVVSDLSTDTDLQGNFHFDEVLPGRYMLGATRPGYLVGFYATNRGPVFTIATGQTMTGIIIKMTPQGIIAGKVVDEDREPLPGLTVRVRVSSGSHLPDFPPPITGTTDADGAFAIGGLNPGRYTVSVAAPPNPSTAAAATETPKEAYVTTYYPDQTDLADATPVEVGAGAQVRGLEIRLKKVPIVNVRGNVVVAATGEAGSPEVVNLIRRGSQTPGLPARAASVRGGEFSFEGILPGDYIIEAKPAAETEGRRSLVGCEPISVGQADVDRLVLQMKPAIELSGRVIIDGAPVSSWPQVTLTPTEGLNYPDGPMIGADGRFTVTGLEPMQYHVTVNPIPPPLYLKSLRFNGLPLNSDIDLAGAPAGSLEIVIGYGTSSMSGVVSDLNGPAGPAVTVVAERKSQFPPRFAQTDESGRFSFSGMPPGEYFLVAEDVGGRAASRVDREIGEGGDRGGG
ncbi:MAG TPA: carboxypeptidase regulatory-like domain-containing protein [Bryobacteraceae bacterium]|nr:carboxypeptidase regulatory-like domain-containing protein [Bryobacteraceae bacterium]